LGDGGDAFVHISLSKNGHIFAFRVLHRSSVRRLRGRAGLVVPPPFSRGKLPREGRRVKLYFTVTPAELVRIDDAMKRLGCRTRAEALRSILWDYFRDKKYGLDEPSDVDFARFLRPEPGPDTLVKSLAAARDSAKPSVSSSVDKNE
jgi:hypothetical protein